MKHLGTNLTGLGVAGALRKRGGLHLPRRKQIIKMSDTDPVVTPSFTRFAENRFRGGTHLHVSDLLYKCIRKIALAEHLGEEIHAERLWPGRDITFRLGHATQDYLTDLLKLNSPNQFYGGWKCACGAIDFTGRTWGTVRDMTCGTCGRPPVTYKEVVIKDDEYGITGSIDVLLLIEAFFYVAECKSIAKQSWENLRRPKPEHLLQALMYWWLLRKAGWALWDKVSVLYINKEFMWAGSPFKEYTFTPSLVIDRIDDLLVEASHLTCYRERKVLPPRVMCDSQASPDAKECQFRQVCFELPNERCPRA